MLRTVLELKPELAAAHNSLGLAYKEKGYLDAAISSFRRAIAFQPDYAAAYNNLGTIYREQGEFEESFAACRRRWNWPRTVQTPPRCNLTWAGLLRLAETSAKRSRASAAPSN